jgi:hypothetical protein
MNEMYIETESEIYVYDKYTEKLFRKTTCCDKDDSKEGHLS